MRLRGLPGLTFDDVLLVPKRSPVITRRAVSTATRLSRHIDLHIPIVSANMDTVTESAMAIAMARAGAIGIIHRFISIQRQAEEVAKVKRSENLVVDRPYTIAPQATIGDARDMMARSSIGGLVVIDTHLRVVGLVTTRDVLFADDPGAPVTLVMTPRERLVTAPPGIAVDDARTLLHYHRLEKLPLVDAEGQLHGLITARDIIRRAQYPNATKDAKGRLRVGAAIGIRDTMLRATALIEAGVDVLVLDIAHGHSDHAIDALRHLRREFGDVELIAGNVATAEGARDLVDAGADAVKVGIGPGSTCITRVVTGCGVPQLTAIAECAEATDAPIIADGGVRASGDIVKALAAGAQSVMIGNPLAGTQEAPGVTVMRNGRKYKLSRGMASLGAMMARSKEDDEDWEAVVAEGIEAAAPYRGTVDEALTQLVGGLRSGMSYCGAMTIAQLQTNAEFIQVTPAGLKESYPHDVEVL